MTCVLTFCTACGPAVSTLCSGDKEKEMQNMHVQPKFLILTNRSRPACNWNKAGVLPKHCWAVLEGEKERLPLLFQKIMALIITFLFLALPIRCQVLETVKVIFIFCKSSQRLLQWGNWLQELLALCHSHLLPLSKSVMRLLPEVSWSILPFYFFYLVSLSLYNNSLFFLMKH